LVPAAESERSPSRNYLKGRGILFPARRKEVRAMPGSDGEAAQKLKSRLAAITLRRVGLRYVTTAALAKRLPSFRRPAAPFATRSRAHG
jgi:hypothetical protein